MIEFTPEEIDKLPKWAQKKVQDLIRRVNTAERRADEARLPTQEGANTFLHPYDEIPIGLTNGDPIRFQLDPTHPPSHYRSSIDVSVREHGMYGSVLVVSGSDSLIIYPHASNVIYVKHARDIK